MVTSMKTEKIKGWDTFLYGKHLHQRSAYADNVVHYTTCTAVKTNTYCKITLQIMTCIKIPEMSVDNIADTDFIMKKEMGRICLIVL